MILLVPIAIALLYALYLLPAFRFLTKYQTKIRTGSSGSARSEFQIAGVTVHVYPSLKQSSTTLILIPGLHPNGIFDPRFVGFAESCAQQGFHITGLDVEDFRNFRLEKSTFDRIQSVVDELPQHLPPESRKRTGVLGISYGAGPAFQIAAKNKIDFIVSIGGYFNLQHAIEFSFSGLHGSVKRNVHEWGRLIFAASHLNDLADGADREILQQSLRLRLQLKEEEAKELETSLSTRGNHLLQGILNDLTDEQRNLFRSVAGRRETETRDLSPEFFLEKMEHRTSLYLIHGVSDNSIPYDESIELHQAARQKGFQSHCLITDALTHVDVMKPSAFVDFLKLLHWIRTLLKEAK